MRLAALPFALLAAGCGGGGPGDDVRDAYENKAAAIDAQAANQSGETARKIYESRAEAIREEGEDREMGLEGGEPSSGQAAGQPSSSGG